MTLPLPLWDGTADGMQFILDRIALAMPDTGGIAIRERGSSGTLTWPGGASPSNVLTVSHGLGTTPTEVHVTVATLAGLTAVPSIKADNWTATSFDVRAQTVDAQNPLNTATAGFSWRAFG